GVVLVACIRRPGRGCGGRRASVPWPREGCRGPDRRAPHPRRRARAAARVPALLRRPRGSVLRRECARRDRRARGPGPAPGEADAGAARAALSPARPAVPAPRRAARAGAEAGDARRARDAAARRPVDHEHFRRDDGRRPRRAAHRLGSRGGRAGELRSVDVPLPVPERRAPVDPGGVPAARRGPRQAPAAGSGAEPPVRDRGIRSLRESRHLARRGDPPAERRVGLGAARRGRALVRRLGAGAPRLMATIVVSPFDVANFPEGGGHFWVYMQYVQGLSRLGCQVYWLEQFRHRKDPDRDARALATFFERMERFGLAGRVLLYTRGDGEDGPIDYLGVTRHEAEAVLRRADLLLNFHYAIDPRILACARRAALVDLDPGLTQLWISTGQLRVPTPRA